MVFRTETVYVKTVREVKKNCTKTNQFVKKKRSFFLTSLVFLINCNKFL